MSANAMSCDLQWFLDRPEQWAERDDPESDYRLLRLCGSVIVCVREEAHDTIECYRVKGEACPSYYASMVVEVA